MAKIEIFRERVASVSPEYISAREQEGWRLVEVAWEREATTGEEEPARGAARQSLGQKTEEIPFGTRIAADGLHLEENSSEMQVLNALAEMIVQDMSYTRMADLLNERNSQTREGRPWTAVAVFKLTSRLIEVAPRILSGEEWEQRKRQLARVAWNS